jgi:DNA-binding transcriptional LysR family regulator
MAITHEMNSAMANAANEMAVFERVAARGSFAAAADDVGLSASAVSKLISRLESRLGVRLINRTTRRLAMTAEGATYLKRSREILAAIELAEVELASGRTVARGHLRVHAPPVLISDHVAPVLPSFLERYPHVTVEFLVANRVVNLVTENVDISFRIGSLRDSSLVARKIMDLSQIVCASPGYLARHGVPLTPPDLAKHACLALTSTPAPTTWRFKLDGKPIAVEVTGPISADSADVLVRLALEGVGIVCLGELAVAKALINGSLVQLLKGVQMQHAYPVWALLPAGRQRSAKVKVFLDFMANSLNLTQWRTR